MIAITLRNNLMTTLPGIFPCCSRLRQWQCTLIATLPPLAVACVWRNVDALAGVTGGYAGIFIQLAIPGYLAMLARRWERANVDDAGANPQKAAAFAHERWPAVVIGWGMVCLVANTTFHLLSWAPWRHE